MSQVTTSKQRVVLGFAVVAAPIAWTACAQDVILGEHTPVGPSSQMAAAGSSTELSDLSVTSSPESDVGQTTSPQHWHETERDFFDGRDGGRIFDEREGGPRWPPKPGEQPLNPRPAHSDAEFPFEPPGEDFAPGASSDP